MATKTVYATETFRYGTRMLKAGDPIDMTAPDARLFVALGKVTDGAPRAITSLARADADGSGNLLPTITPVKRVRRKRATKKK